MFHYLWQASVRGLTYGSWRFEPPQYLSRESGSASLSKQSERADPSAGTRCGTAQNSCTLSCCSAEIRLIAKQTPGAAGRIRRPEPESRDSTVFAAQGAISSWTTARTPQVPGPSRVTGSATARSTARNAPLIARLQQTRPSTRPPPPADGRWWKVIDQQLVGLSFRPDAADSVLR